jgi:membrane-associated phospholipid phosphatase
VHWPSDVLAGMLVGAAIAALASLLFRRFYRESARGEPRDGNAPREPAHSD